MKQRNKIEIFLKYPAMQTGAPLLLIFLLSACSTEIYKNEIDTFSKSLSSLETSFEVAAQKEETILKARELEYMKRNKAFLSLGSTENLKQCDELLSLLISQKDAEFETRLADCPLHFHLPDKTSSPLAQGVDVKNARARITALNTYAKTLSEMAKAEDIAEMDKSATKLRESVISLAKNVGALSGTLVPVSKAAVSIVDHTISGLGNFLQWVFRKHQEYARFKSLKAATKAADNAISLAVPPLSNVLSAQIRQLRINQLGVVNTALSGPIKSKSDLKSALDKFETLKELKSTRAISMLSAMSAAHRKLKQALNDPKTQKSTVIAAFDEFKNQIKELSETMDTLNEGSN